MAIEAPSIPGKYYYHPEFEGDDQFAPSKGKVIESNVLPKASHGVEVVSKKKKEEERINS